MWDIWLMSIFGCSQPSSRATYNVRSMRFRSTWPRVYDA